MQWMIGKLIKHVMTRASATCACNRRRRRRSRCSSAPALPSGRALECLRKAAVTISATATGPADVRGATSGMGCVMRIIRRPAL